VLDAPLTVGLLKVLCEKINECMCQGSCKCTRGKRKDHSKALLNFELLLILQRFFSEHRFIARHQASGFHLVPVMDEDLHVKAAQDAHPLEGGPAHHKVYRLTFADGAPEPVPCCAWAERKGDAWYVLASGEAEARASAPEAERVTQQNGRAPVRVNLGAMGEVFAFILATKLGLQNHRNSLVAVECESVRAVFEAINETLLLIHPPAVNKRQEVSAVVNLESFGAKMRSNNVAKPSLAELLMTRFHFSHFPSTRGSDGEHKHIKRCYVGKVLSVRRGEPRLPLMMGTTLRWGTHPIVTLRQLLSAVPEGFKPCNTYAVGSSLLLKDRMAFSNRVALLCTPARDAASTGRSSLPVAERSGTLIKKEKGTRILELSGVLLGPQPTKDMRNKMYPYEHALAHEAMPTTRMVSRAEGVFGENTGTYVINNLTGRLHAPMTNDDRAREVLRRTCALALPSSEQVESFRGAGHVTPVLRDAAAWSAFEAAPPGARDAYLRVLVPEGAPFAGEAAALAGERRLVHEGAEFARTHTERGWLIVELGDGTEPPLTPRAGDAEDDPQWACRQGLLACLQGCLQGGTAPFHAVRACLRTEPRKINCLTTYLSERCVLGDALACAILGGGPELAAAYRQARDLALRQEIVSALEALGDSEFEEIQTVAGVDTELLRRVRAGELVLDWSVTHCKMTHFVLSVFKLSLLHMMVRVEEDPAHKPAVQAFIYYAAAHVPLTDKSRFIGAPTGVDLRPFPEALHFLR
jgi:hypothetical protein